MSDIASSPAPTTSGTDAGLPAAANNEATKVSQETPQTEPRKLRVKVDGQEQEITEEQAAKDYELRAASYKRMAEAAAKDKEFKEFQEQLETDPIKLLKSKNPKFRELAEKYLADELMEEMRSPEEKARKQLEEENKTYKQKEKEQKEKEAADEDARHQAKIADELDKELSRELEKTFLPKDQFTVSRIADKMIQHLKAGVDISYADAVQMVEQQEITNFRKGLSTMEGDKLLKYLGEDIAEKIRKADIGRLKSNPTSARPNRAAPHVTPAKSASKRSLSDLEAILASKRE